MNPAPGRVVRLLALDGLQERQHLIPANPGSAVVGGGEPAQGIGQVGVWLGRVLGALTLDRSTYRDVAKDPLMTGPAVLIFVLAMLVQASLLLAGFDVRLHLLQ